MRDRGRGIAAITEGRAAVTTLAAANAADRYDNELLTVAQAAREATVREHTIRRGYFGGHLRVQRMGMGARLIRIRRRDLLAWMNAGANTLMPEGRIR